MKPIKTIGFIGLGNMGSPMAANLLAAGYQLVVLDADSKVQEDFVSRNGCAVATGPLSFQDVDAIITMLPDDRAVAQALLDGGIAASLRPGALVIDMSSSNPIGTRDLRDHLPQEIGLVDAPVSGGVARATTGQLSIMCGSDDPAMLERARPVFEALGKRIFPTGRLGSGHALKALNNYLAAAAYVAASEALVIGNRFGMDAQAMLEVINTSTGRSFCTEEVFGANVVTGRYATGFAIGLLAKDVNIASTLADGLGVNAPGLQLVSRMWSEASSRLGGSADHSKAHIEWWPGELEFLAGTQEPA
jgi:3-hydroxyisobutyrate dehydrogenase